MILHWIKIGMIGIGSLFFLFWGIENLVNSYQLTHPQMFVMYFLSSNLMILISLTGLLFSIIRLFNFLNKKR